MIDQDEITRRLDQLEIAHAQDYRVLLARMELVEAQVERLESKLQAVHETIQRMERNLYANMDRLEGKIDLVFEMLKTITERLGE